MRCGEGWVQQGGVNRIPQDRAHAYGACARGLRVRATRLPAASTGCRPSASVGPPAHGSAGGREVRAGIGAVVAIAQGFFACPCSPLQRRTQRGAPCLCPRARVAGCCSARVAPFGVAGTTRNLPLLGRHHEQGSPPAVLKPLNAERREEKRRRSFNSFQIVFPVLFLFVCLRVILPRVLLCGQKTTTNNNNKKEISPVCLHCLDERRSRLCRPSPPSSRVTTKVVSRVVLLLFVSPLAFHRYVVGRVAVQSPPPVAGLQPRCERCTEYAAKVPCLCQFVRRPLGGTRRRFAEGEAHEADMHDLSRVSRIYCVSRLLRFCVTGFQSWDVLLCCIVCRADPLVCISACRETCKPTFHRSGVVSASRSDSARRHEHQCGSGPANMAYYNFSD